MNNFPILTAVNLYKSYAEGPNSVEVLKAVDFTINAGEKIAVVGPSGSGKSTLLHLMGGLDNPSAGELLIYEQNWQQLTEKKRCELRNAKLGFIYQFHHLLPEFSALENAAMPLLLAGYSVQAATSQAEKMLDQVGLNHRWHHKPSELSGGERQRVAIARALIHQPVCVLADEPTGNLDQKTAAMVFDLMINLNQQSNSALVIVTHDASLAAKMDKIWTLENGHLHQSK